MSGNIFNGPPITGAGAGPQYSNYVFADPIVGTGAAWGGPTILTFNDTTQITGIGLGNCVIANIYSDIGNPANATDTKWVDVSLDYSAGARRASPDRDNFPPSYFSPNEIISERDPLLPGTHRLYHRWRIHRTPVANDTENIHPLIAAGETAVRAPTILDWAIGDFLRVTIDLVALDESVGAILAVGETIQMQVAWGTSARSW
jgi:hypothetical protein